MTDGSVTTVPLDQPLYGASPLQAVSRFFRKYGTFSGRASLSEFWWSRLFIVVVQLLIWIPGIAVGVATSHREISATTGQPTSVPGPAFAIFALVGVLVFLALLVPDIAVSVRRLHDGNFPGGLYLVSLLGGIGGIVVLVLCCLPSNPVGVRYDLGAQPPAPAPYPYPPTPPSPPAAPAA